MEAISSQAILAVLVQLLVLCLIIERALHFLFHFGLWRSFFDAQSNSKEIKSLKALIVLGISWWVCSSYDINAILEITSPGTTINPEDRTIREFLGIGITALVIAGGSAGIREIIKTMSSPKPNS